MERIYVDHGLTGTNRDRSGLCQALAACRAGDTLVVTRLGRLARSLPGARAIAEDLTKRKVRLSLGASNEHAGERGQQRVVLDVVQDADAAMRLYDALGWQRVDTLALTITSDHRLDLWVYVSPLTGT